MLYSASAAMHPDAHLTLVLAALADESADAQERAFAVGRRWAEGMGLADQPERLEQLLTQFGFRPERDGDVVRLRGCPWARAATEHPRVICTLHRGLSQAIVGDDRPLELVPFAGEHMCELRVGQQVSGG